MNQEIHDTHGAGFSHIRDLLPSPDNIGTNNNRQLSLFQEENAINTYTQKAFGNGIVEKGDARGKGRKGKGAANTPAVDKSWMPRMLAEKLHDEKNLAFYEFVVRRLPEELIRDALTRALDVPVRNIRRSRGALFASIVAPQLKAQRRARTQSESSIP